MATSTSTSTSTSTYEGRTYERLTFVPASKHTIHCAFNRTDKLNAWDLKMWEEVRYFFADVAMDASCRIVILSANGRIFTAGLDLKDVGPLTVKGPDVARNGLSIRRSGKEWQQSLTNIVECGKPVIICIHKACIGVGVELASACDIRLCTEDAFFAMPEVSIGLAADVGGLQRFPKIVGNDSIVRELALTGRRFGSKEAKEFGFVSRVCSSKEDMMAQAKDIADMIASKSPVATHGVKTLLNYSRDHSVPDSLDYALTWNQSMIQTNDMAKAAMSQLMKNSPPPQFDPLPSHSSTSSTPPSKAKL